MQSIDIDKMTTIKTSYNKSSYYYEEYTYDDDDELRLPWWFINFSPLLFLLFGTMIIRCLIRRTRTKRNRFPNRKNLGDRKELRLSPQGWWYRFCYDTGHWLLTCLVVPRRQHQQKENQALQRQHTLQESFFEAIDSISMKVRTASTNTRIQMEMDESFDIFRHTLLHNNKKLYNIDSESDRLRNRKLHHMNNNDMQVHRQLSSSILSNLDPLIAIDTEEAGKDIVSLPMLVPGMYKCKSRPYKIQHKHDEESSTPSSAPVMTKTLQFNVQPCLNYELGNCLGGSDNENVDDDDKKFQYYLMNNDSTKKVVGWDLSGHCLDANGKQCCIIEEGYLSSSYNTTTTTDDINNRQEIYWVELYDNNIRVVSHGYLRRDDTKKLRVDVELGQTSNLIFDNGEWLTSDGIRGRYESNFMYIPKPDYTIKDDHLSTEIKTDVYAAVPLLQGLVRKSSFSTSLFWKSSDGRGDSLDPE